MVRHCEQKRTRETSAAGHRRGHKARPRQSKQSRQSKSGRQQSFRTPRRGQCQRERARRGLARTGDGGRTCAGGRCKLLHGREHEARHGLDGQQGKNGAHGQGKAVPGRYSSDLSSGVVVDVSCPRALRRAKKNTTDTLRTRIHLTSPPPHADRWGSKLWEGGRYIVVTVLTKLEAFAFRDTCGGFT